MRKIGFVLIFFIASSVYAGGITSTGGDDLLASDGSAWFLGTKPIRYCIQKAPDFGPSDDEVREVVSSVFRKWKDYVLLKGINTPASFENQQSRMPELDYDQYNNPSDVVAGKAAEKKLALETSFLPTCDNTVDLRFILGLETPEIQLAKKDFSHPIAFANRTVYDAEIGWGKGYIWVTDGANTRGGKKVWTLPDRLLGVLLHEVGHVYGNSHLDQTIMAQTIPVSASEGDYGGEDSHYVQWFFTQIDQSQELFLCRHCAFDFVGAHDQFRNEVFKKLTGREPKGEIQSRLYAERISKYHRSIYLVLSDSEGSFRFRANSFPSLLGMHFGDTPLFKKAIMARHAELFSSATSELVQMTDENGKVFPMILNRNMGYTATLLLLDPAGSESNYVFHPMNWTDR